MDELSVSSLSIERHGVVSEEVASEMAEGLRKKFSVDIAVSTSGIAGPQGGSSKKPVGTLAIGISTESETKGKLYKFLPDDRIELKKRFCARALLTLLQKIKKV